MSSRRDCSVAVSVEHVQGVAKLTDTQVSVDGGIAGGTGQVLVLTVRNVKVRLGVAVFLGQTEINHVDLVATLPNAHEEVVRLNVAVDKRFGVDVLDAGDELVGKEQHRLERELAVAKVEEILQTGAEEIQNHGIVVALGAEPTHKRNADAASERLVDAGLIFQLGVLSLDALELDGNLFARDDIRACLAVSRAERHSRRRRTEVNVAEAAAANLAANPVLVSDAKILLQSAPASQEGEPGRKVRSGVGRTMVVMLQSGQPRGGWPWNKVMWCSVAVVEEWCGAGPRLVWRCSACVGGTGQWALPARRCVSGPSGPGQ